MKVDFRPIILQRLKLRDKECQQFTHIFESYEALTDSFFHLIQKSKNSIRRRQSITECELNEEIDNLSTELSDLYKTKSKNDQQIIDKNLRLIEIEKTFNEVLNEHNITKIRIKEAKDKLLNYENELKNLKEVNDLLNKDFNLSKTIYNNINEKYIAANQECNELIENIKKMKSEEVLMLNKFNERVEKRRIAKICSDLEDATKLNNSFDVNLKSLKNNDQPSSLGSDNNSLKLCGDVIPTQCRYKIEANEMGEVNDCLFHPTDFTFFTAGNDKCVKMFQLKNNSFVKSAIYDGANQAITRIDLDISNKFLSASSNDKTIRIWGVSDRQLKFTFAGHTDKVVAAKFFNTGRYIGSGSNDRTIKIFDISGNRCIRTFFASSIVLDVAINDNFGAQIISSHFDKNVRFWDTRIKDIANSFKLGGKVTSLFVGPDNKSILCSCRDETLSLVDLRNNGILHIYSAERYKSASDNCKCLISPNGCYVGSGSADGNIFIWNTNTTRLEKVLFKNAHKNVPILSLAWHPHKNIILSGDKRKTVCIWE